MTVTSGLSQHILEKIKGVFKGFPEIQQVDLYGSRARGDYRPDSDIDLAVKAPEMTFDRFLLLKGKLDDLPVVFKIDTVQYDTLEKEDLIQKIDRESVPFFKTADEH